MGQRSWGCRHSRQGGEFGIADVVFRAYHPNKYDGDDGCGSMMMEDGKMKLTPRQAPSESEEQVLETIRCPLDGDIPLN